MYVPIQLENYPTCSVSGDPRDIGKLGSTYDRDGLVVRDGADGACTISANSGNFRFHVFRVGWKTTAQFFHGLFCSFEEASRTGIITQALPESVDRLDI